MGVDGARELGQMRCERGADIARAIDLDEHAAGAIHQLDEHWDGHGYPGGLAGELISPLARVICLAQTMEVFWSQGGPAAACAVARERRGTLVRARAGRRVAELRARRRLLGLAARARRHRAGARRPRGARR